MPVSLIDFIIGSLIMVAIVVGVIGLNRWKTGVGWKFFIGVVAFYIVGNIVERSLQ